MSRVHCAALLIVDIFGQLHNCFKVLVCRSGKKTTYLFHEEWVLQERGVSWSGMELVGLVQKAEGRAAVGGEELLCRKIILWRPE